MYDDDLNNKLLKQTKTKDVISKLYSLNYGLVVTQLKMFNLEKDEDAISYANEALYKAITHFNETKSTRFSTFATVCIKNSIRQLLRERSNNKLQMISFNTPIDNTEGITLEDVLQSDVCTETCALDEQFVDYIKKVVFRVIQEYNIGTAKKILMKWYQSNFSLTNQQLADTFDVSQPYVNKVINNFRVKLRRKI